MRLARSFILGAREEECQPSEELERTVRGKLLYDYILRVKLNQHDGYSQAQRWQLLSSHTKEGLLSSKGLFENGSIKSGPCPVSLSSFKGSPLPTS